MASLLSRCWRRLVVVGGVVVNGGVAVDGAPHFLRRTARCYHAPMYEVKVGIPEFLKGVGNGVDAHAAKLEAEVGDLDKLLFTRTLRLKKLGIPVKHANQIRQWVKDTVNYPCRGTCSMEMDKLEDVRSFASKREN